MTPIRYILVIATSAIFLVGGIWFWPSADARQNLMEGQVVRSEEADWVASNVVWSEFDGSWYGRVTLAPIRTRVRVSIDPSLFYALCGVILTAMPDGPEQVSRRDVARLDINVVTTGARKNEIKQVTNGYLPFAVHSGACERHTGLGGIYFVSYGGELEGWQATVAQSIHADDASPVLKVLFNKTSRADVSLENFPYKNACRALLQDLTFNEILSLRDESTPPRYGNQMEIIASNKVHRPSVDSETGQGMRFDIVNGACISTQLGDQT